MRVVGEFWPVQCDIEWGLQKHCKGLLDEENHWTKSEHWLSFQGHMLIFWQDSNPLYPENVACFNSQQADLISIELSVRN